MFYTRGLFSGWLLVEEPVSSLSHSQFPSVMVGGYSIACRNLTYSVTYQRRKHKVGKSLGLCACEHVLVFESQIEIKWLNASLGHRREVTQYSHMT